MASLSKSPPTAINELHPDLLTRILRLLDGPSLSSASSSSSLLHSLSSQSSLWLHLSLSTFPSLRHSLTFPFLSRSPRSFFADAFPFPDSPPPSDSTLTGPLISAVDIFHNGTLVLSTVSEIQTSSPWFRGSPFLIDAVSEQIGSAEMISPGDLNLSWILIDSETGRAVNVSSRRPVGIERNCYTGETVVRFGMVIEGERVIGGIVCCGEGEGHVREVVLTCEDIDGVCVSGEDVLRVLRGMMGVGRKGKRGLREEDEMKRRYLEYLKRKKMRKESVARREGVLDFCFSSVGVFVFFAFLLLFVCR